MSNPSTPLGTFYGIGVGPGPAGLLPLCAVEALQTCDLIFCPKAESKATSAARWCLRGLALAEEKFQEISFTMNPDREVLGSYYGQLAQQIAKVLENGKNVAYLTLGDSLTYSTYGYTIAALLDLLPHAPHRTFPGITSYAALAATFNWPLGEGKERVLILPCPADMEALQQDIETHDIVVLMKMGRHFPHVLELLRAMNIADHCVFAGRLGFDDEILSNDVASLPAESRMGYLSTLLIRKTPKEKRHS